MDLYPQLTNFDTLLLQWYHSNARVLPWRTTPTPYRVWVSEIMLQQTRVEAVIPYFERFVSVLPNIMALARCPEHQLLKLWEGLGYYNRVRNLQKAAIQVMERYNGELPPNYQELLTLPGIGEYTAGAIGSIAYNLPVPAADGNVFRVLARVLARDDDIADAKVRKWFREVEHQLLPAAHAGAFNQAMMELGATVCIPNGMPLCEKCPVAALCLAYRQGNQQNYPVKTPNKPRRMEQRTLLILQCGEKVCVQKRPSKGLLAGLWEFLNIPEAVEEDGLPQYLRGLGITQYQLWDELSHKHIFTHVEWHMKGYFITLQTMPNLGKWVPAGKLQTTYPMPGAMEPFKQRIWKEAHRAQSNANTL